MEDAGTIAEMNTWARTLQPVLLHAGEQAKKHSPYLPSNCLQACLSAASLFASGRAAGVQASATHPH
jgi:hypothetical protein